MNKKPAIVRVYLPPDANTLLSHLRPLPALAALRQRRRRRQAAAGRLADGRARPRCTARAAPASGSGRAPSGDGDVPDVVLACAGDVPTLETLAAASILRDAAARPAGAGRQRRRPDAAAARDRAPARPARPGVRHAVHHRPAGDLRLPRLPVAGAPAHLPAHATTRTCTCAGYKESGTTTTPFDMVMLNDLDRYHLVMDVIDRVAGLGARAAAPAPGDGRRPAAGPDLDARARRGHPGGGRLDLGGLARAGLLLGSGSPSGTVHSRRVPCGSSSRKPHRAAEVAGAAPHVAQPALAALGGQPLAVVGDPQRHLGRRRPRPRPPPRRPRRAGPRWTAPRAAPRASAPRSPAAPPCRPARWCAPGA